MIDELKYKKGSNNIFKDLGLENPEERLAKAKIASMIYDIIEERRLTQKKAGVILGVNQPKISALRNGKLDGFSIERLFSFLRALDQDVDIVIHPKLQNKAKLNLAYAHGC
jgi:predicted XRE-type DNA-binding protein